MRAPQDVPSRAVKPRAGRARWWVVGGILVLVVVLASLRSLAGLYTDSLWYSSVGLHRVWSTLLAVKLGLFASFGAAFFVLLWVNLVLCDRLAAVGTGGSLRDDLVVRYQRSVRPYAGRVYAALAFAAALVAAATTIGQWNNWLLFTHATSFAQNDPVFGVNAGFFVFRLPFLQFLLDWVLASLVVVLALTALFHYLNGGIRSGGIPKVRPVVKAHLSVLLALVALVKAAGYVLQRYSLDTSTNGYVEGAGYTDVHARLPALELLGIVSLFAAAVLLYNIRRQGWTLPVIAVGLWALVALVVGVIYPAVLQAVKVNPAQSQLEAKYIARNIAATRSAYGLGSVAASRYADATAIPPKTVQTDITTLSNIRVWDPIVLLRGFKSEQQISNYYTFQSAQVERATTGDTGRPVIVGVREIDPTGISSQSWVNTHLQYTHGEGLVVADANTSTGTGSARFAVSGVPPKSTSGADKVSQPAVYFGLHDPGYVVVDTHQKELDFQKRTGAYNESHYRGKGGVKLTSVVSRAAFALRLGDFNLLLSKDITPSSRIMYVRNVRTMAEKAAPFLSFDSQPYAAVVNGRIDWVLNAYTTTADYPYSQSATSVDVPPGGSLPRSFNYIRNSVIVVVNAYSGKMTFYAMDDDPILRAYESAFPKMFTPESAMPPALRMRLRYGSDLFALQAALYGRYHVTDPSRFYTAGDTWVVSPSAGIGSPTQTLPLTCAAAQGQLATRPCLPMTPVYQVMALPGEATQSLTIADVYVPAGGRNNSSASQPLKALLIGSSGPRHFGELRVYETPPGTNKLSPIQADTEIERSAAVKRTLTPLNKGGSKVLLGTTLPVLVGQSVVYIRPVYVVSKKFAQPQLKDVIAVLGKHVKIDPTLGATLNALLGTTLRNTSRGLRTTPSSPTVAVPQSSTKSAATDIAEARHLLTQAAKDFAQAEADLKTGNLAGYKDEITAAKNAASEAEHLLGGTSASANGAAGTAPTGTGSAGSGSGGSASTTGTGSKVSTNASANET